jgi:hypothetical protein
MISIDGGQPHRLAVLPLHTPHPLHGLGVQAADGAIEHDAPEDLQAGEALV